MCLRERTVSSDVTLCAQALVTPTCAPRCHQSQADETNASARMRHFFVRPPDLFPCEIRIVRTRSLKHPREYRSIGRWCRSTRAITYATTDLVNPYHRPIDPRLRFRCNRLVNGQSTRGGQRNRRSSRECTITDHGGRRTRLVCLRRPRGPTSTSQAILFEAPSYSRRRQRPCGEREDL
jgi:hypothetical protein